MAEIGQNIDFAKRLLESNDLVGIPTETVYGLAGNALSIEAILKIYKVKNRPSFDPLITHADTIEKIQGIVDDIPETAQKLIETLWPGPLTLLLPKAKHVPEVLTSGLPRIAVRIPKHPLTIQLLQQLDFPLAAPSANPFGYVSPTNAHHVDDQLGFKIKYILNGGPCPIGLESTIVGFEEGRTVLYRLGGIPLESIEKIVGRVELKLNQSSDPTAPGMLRSHYAPGPQVIISDLSKLKFNQEDAVISYSTDYNHQNQVILSPRASLDEAAKNIFSALRQFDNDNIRRIYVELVPEVSLGRAINDRIRRAAYK